MKIKKSKDQTHQIIWDEVGTEFTHKVHCDIDDKVWFGFFSLIYKPIDTILRILKEEIYK